jgi:hypothetical protein
MFLLLFMVWMHLPICVTSQLEDLCHTHQHRTTTKGTHTQIGGRGVGGQAYNHLMPLFK